MTKSLLALLPPENRGFHTPNRNLPVNRATAEALEQSRIAELQREETRSAAAARNPRLQHCRVYLYSHSSSKLADPR